MDSTKDEFEALAKDPDELQGYLTDQIHIMSQTLKDDEDFCNNDIDITTDYVKTIKRKFMEKFQEFETKLEDIRRENQKISDENKKKFDEEIENINELFKAKKYPDAWKKFKDYEKSFQQRSTVLNKIPRLYMDENDIERCFAPDHRPIPIEPPSAAPVPTSHIEDDQPDASSDTPLTSKEEKRRKKVVESVNITKDNEELNVEKNDQPSISSQFGARSKLVENSQPFPSPPPPPPPPQRIYLSDRLRPSSKKTTTTSVNFTLSPVSHYQHDRNKILLMACNYNYIVLFKSQRNRLDLWHLGAIGRGTQTEHNLEWHNGLIISMGCISNDSIYMFTEREFYIYSIAEKRAINSRVLPRGNDEETNSSSTEYYRGIGIVHDNHWYHIYSNRSSHWTLSINSLNNNLAHFSDKDLTILYPEVARFIHLSVTDKVFYYLVQMNDLTYAVVTQGVPPVILNGAKQPLTIYSSYNEKSHQPLCFINDPLIDTLHIVTKDRYLQSYPLTAYAIYYFAEKNELMIVSKNSISSINLNQLNLVSS